MSKLNQNPRGSLWKIFYIEVRKRFADVLDSVEAGHIGTESATEILNAQQTA